MARLSWPGWLVIYHDKCPALGIEPGHGHPFSGSLLWSVICDSCGGIEMVAQAGKIKLDNTLDSRLELISHQVSEHG